jgi:hypothetical protein
MSNYSNNPNGGWLESGGFLFTSSNLDTYGVLPSELLIGGYQEFTTLDDRDNIPVNNSGGSSMINPDGISSGRRKIGMIVKTIDPEGNGQVESKTYCLIPKGYFGNEGQLSITDWNALSSFEKVVLLDPTSSVTYTDELTGDDVTVNGTGNPDDCWVELIQFTEHPLPSGGSVGEVLVKNGPEDHDVAWSTVVGTPGPQGAPGVDASIVDRFIGNLWTHPTTPGKNGVASGLAVDGPVEIVEGDMFSVIVPADVDSSTAPLNGTFIAKNSWTHPQTPNNVNGLIPLMDLLAHYGTDFEPIVTSFPQELQETSNFTVTVSSNGKFEIDGVEQRQLVLMKGQRYIFDITAVDWFTHPLKFSATEDGVHNGGEWFYPIYGYNMFTSDGQDPPAFTSYVLDIPSSWPDQLFYYCENHADMGGTINLIGEFSDLRSDIMKASIIPDTNAAYDIGSAEYKVRHLYLSDNSVYFGDENVPLNSTKVRNTLNFSLDPALPGGPSDPVGGLKGDIRFDLNYLYICVEDGQWKRVAFDNTWIP